MIEYSLFCRCATWRFSGSYKWVMSKVTSIITHIGETYNPTSHYP